MCLVALAVDQDRRFPLVLATNRDEFLARPAARLGWWSPGEGWPSILGGRDLSAGGTWLGLTAAGRLALVTNVRRPGATDPEAPSRGAIVPLWLRGELSADRFWMRVALSGHNPFNLIAADFRQGECFWASSDTPYPRRIERTIVGLSNGGLDEPWPKVVRLKERMKLAMRAAPHVDSLAARLFEVLADRREAPDDALPRTGVPLELERRLSSLFVHMPERGYGTRCSTLVIAERSAKRLVTHVFERTFTPGSTLALLRRSTLKDWPPKYRHDGGIDAAVVGPVSDVELPPGAAEAQRRRRVRSLLKPAR